jgi:benzoyl-CoA reductase/2-hydroxyglutaryl-CoA dehydratase subunit BcrC/BadD/HgdB
MSKVEKARLDKQLERLKGDKALLQGLVDMLGMDPSEEADINRFVLKTVMDKYDEIMNCAENDIPFMAAYFANCPEIFTAMDVPWWIFLQTPFLGVSSPFLASDTDETEKMGLATEFCTVLRLAMFYVAKDLTPKPAGLIALLHPCDGTVIIHQAIAKSKAWHDVPVFGADSPYWEDERTYKYYAEETKRMVDFVTQCTGKKLDIDRLREVCKISNQIYQLWADYNELRKAVPCPHDWTIGPPQCFALACYYYPGKIEAVDWFKKVVANAEKRVKAKQGMAAGERIRVLWFDILPILWQFDISPWLEQEWGVNIVMNMFGYTPYEPIDTKNEYTMFRDLAKRSLTQVPMIRQARGVADNFLADIERIVKDYKIDCVIWPGHMGHKDGNASIGMMREKCREIGVPFLSIGLDLFDKRYTAIDVVKDRISKFFQASGLGQNK